MCDVILVVIIILRSRRDSIIVEAAGFLNDTNNCADVYDQATPGNIMSRMHACVGSRAASNNAVLLLT